MTLTLSASTSKISVERIESKRLLSSRSAVSTRRPLPKPTPRTNVFKSESLTFICFLCFFHNNQSSLSIFRLADAALSAAGNAKKSRTPQAADAFLCVQDEIIRFGSPPSRKEAPGSHRRRLSDTSTALKNAAEKDNKTTTFLSKVKSAFKTPVSHLSFSDYPTVHNAELASQRSRKECKLCDSSIASRATKRSIDY